MPNFLQTLLSTPVGAWGLIFALVAAVLFIVVLYLINSRKGVEKNVQAFAHLLDEGNRQTQAKLQSVLGEENSRLRMEVQQQLTGMSESQQKSMLGFAQLVQQMNEQVAQSHIQNREASTKQLGIMTENLSQELSAIRQTLNNQLQTLQANNDKKLESMRATVEEKLQTTLETRLSESFKQVAAQLKEVESGLGEMRALAGQVGELKRVLTNVKTRGTFGEVQLKAILDEIIPTRYEENVVTIPGSNDRVEFAVKLPGNDLQDQVWLPIDSKFPMEDYLKIEAAREASDAQEAEVNAKALEARLRNEAKKIHEKYVRVPYTTEFAILFLPSESLYAECLRRVGVIEELQTKYRITIAGPTVLCALLNSLQMGFRTLAIQQRSAEVWAILGNVKAEFTKFAAAIDAMDKNVDTIKNAIGKVRTRTNVMGRQLRNVEELPQSEKSDTLLAIDNLKDE